MSKKRYPFSLKENGSYLEHAKDVLIRRHDPDAAEKIRMINEIFRKESFETPGVAWLTWPEMSFARDIIKETMHCRV